MKYAEIMEADGALREDTPDYDLQAKYQHYNKLVWDGQLPEIRIVWATLKGLGGYANATMGVDPSKPKPNPVRVRLGLEDKYSNRFVLPGSMYIKLSALYKRSEAAIDKILLHEMIHVHLMATGHLGEGHGSLFFAELRRVSKIVGFEVPRKDSVGDAEFSDDLKVKPYGVILIKERDGFRYILLSAALVQNQLDAIRQRYESYAQLYKRRSDVPVDHVYATIYLIADKMWSEKAMKIPVPRKLGYGSYRMTDPALLDDLRQNGKVLAEI